MSSIAIRAKIECHADQARRLLSNPLVAEYQHHINCINQLQPVLQQATDDEKSSSDVATEVEQVAATESKSPRTRRRK